MVKIGIVGLGGMGNMHFGVYEALHNARVVAIADVDEERLKPGKSSLRINIGAGGAVIDPSRHKLYTNPDELMADPDVDMIDICLPTFLHAEYVIKAAQAGKHVLCEKPMALTSEECRKVLDAVAECDVKLMIAQCIRFWPAYVYLRETVASGRLGLLNALSMWRGGAMPGWSWKGWLTDSKRSGGALLDLHIHDADFVHHLLGRPNAVCSTGSIGPSGGYDAVETVYVYEDRMAVRTGANMGLPEGFGFEMRYMAAFQKGCLTFSSRHTPGLLEITESGEKHPELKQTDGYHEEMEYFVKCVENNEQPALATPESSAFSVRLVEAEKESIESGKAVAL